MKRQCLLRGEFRQIIIDYRKVATTGIDNKGFRTGVEKGSSRTVPAERKEKDMNIHNMFLRFVRVMMALALVLAAALIPDGMETRAAETDGIWVLTDYHYITPGEYTSKQNSYYKYMDSFEGYTQNGDIVFKVSGGYRGPGDWHTADVYHLCSQPARSYAAGETVTLTMQTIQQNTVKNYRGGTGIAYICKEEKDLPNDGRSKFFKYNIANFNDENGNFVIAAPGETKKGQAKMPARAEFGDRVAVIFVTTSSYDSYSSSYENQYGGYQFFEWIYTYQKKETVAAEPETTGNTAGNTEGNTSGNPKWVLTGTNFYTPSNYTSKSNEYYKYVDSFEGYTQDGAVMFKVSGGYKGPGDWHTADVYHLCSLPARSYAAGETVTLTMQTIQENTVKGYRGGTGIAYICKEDKDLPNDGRSKFFKYNIANFNDENGNFVIAAPGETKEGQAKMPVKAEPGDRVAVTFVTTSSKDSYGETYENGYGGYQFFEWIYTWQ